MSVAEQVKDYVQKRPYIQEALADGIVNYSALARKIEEEVDGGFEAVKMALRRNAEDLKQQRRTRRTNIGKVMSGTSIELRNNVQVCKSEEHQEGLYHAETGSGYTTIQESSQQCKGEKMEDQVIISLKSPENLEDTPGVLAYISSLLAGRDINMTELISCREDTHIVLHEEDATAAFELLNEKLKG